MGLGCEEECGNDVSMARECVVHTTKGSTKPLNGAQCAALLGVHICTSRVLCMGARVCTLEGTYVPSQVQTLLPIQGSLEVHMCTLI